MILLLLGFLMLVTIGGVGLAFAGGGSATAKRTKAIAERTPKVDLQKRERADPEQRRKQIVKSLKEQEKRQRKAKVSLSSLLQQAGLTLTVTRFWVISAVLAVVVAPIVLIVSGKWLLALCFGLGLGIGLPRWVVNFLAKRRANKFTRGFPDATDIIVRGIRSGLPVHECLKIISREAPEPLGSEFRRLVENVGMGMGIDQALDKMYERMPVAELRFFTIVLAIQQKTGGNLAEALGNLSLVLRARRLMREKVKAMASEAVASASIIGSLPPLVMCIISITSPKYLLPLFIDPRGNMILLVGGLWMGTGIFVMRRMINFQF